MSDSDTEWAEALGVEENDGEEQHREEESSDERDVDTEQGTDEDTGEGESSEAESGDDNDGDDSSEGEPEPEGEKEESSEEAEEPPKEEEKVEPSTKDAIREAMREIDSEKAQQGERVQSIKKEIEETLYPEGINRVLRDSDGDPITSIDDLTNLINPDTKDFFTEEEAGKWLLREQQKLNRDVEQVDRFVEEVAETTLQLEEGAKRVADKYGDILSNDEALRTRLLKAYDQTIIKDPKTGVAIRAPMDVEEFFDIALEPRLNQQSAAAEDEGKKEAKKQAAKAAQKERGDLPPSGKAESIDPDDKEWAEAYKEYEEGVV